MRAFVHIATLLTLSFEKELKQVLAILCTNADTIIWDFNFDSWIFCVALYSELLDAHSNDLAPLTELNWVLQEVDYDLLASHFVYLDN